MNTADRILTLVRFGRGFRPAVGRVKEGVKAPASREGDGTAVLLDPADVVLISVALPPLSSGQRASAASFAAEEYLACAPEEVCVVVGPEFPKGSGKWILAVVAPDVLKAASSRAGTQRVYSPLMALPVPVSGFTVAQGPHALLIRQPDGSAFALEPDIFLSLWRANGSPPIVTFGRVSLPDLRSAAAGTTMSDRPPAFDLLGRLDENVLAKRRKAIVPALVVLCVLIAHVLLWTADYYSLRSLERSALTELDTAVERHGASGTDPEATALALLTERQATTPTVPVINYLEPVLMVLEDFGNAVVLRRLRFSRQTSELILSVQSSDIRQLQSLERALVEAELSVTPGPANVRSGIAEAEIRVLLSDGTGRR